MWATHLQPEFILPAQPARLSLKAVTLLCQPITKGDKREGSSNSDQHSKPTNIGQESQSRDDGKTCHQVFDAVCVWGAGVA